jgi:hypothetical protein
MEISHFINRPDVATYRCGSRRLSQTSRITTNAHLNARRAIP